MRSSLYVTLVVLWVSTQAHAAETAFPARPIRFIVPNAAGGSTDLVARTVAQKLGESVGQQIVIDNRPGSGGIIGTELVAKGTADGGAGSARLGAWMRPGSGP